MKLTTTFFLKTKIIWIFLIYGLIVSLLYNSTIGKGGEYMIHFLLNYPVEKVMIPPLLLHYANDVGDPLSIVDLQIIRVILSVMFWGVIGVLLWIYFKF